MPASTTGRARRAFIMSTSLRTGPPVSPAARERASRPPQRSASETPLIRKMIDLSAACLDDRPQHEAHEELREDDGEIEDPHEESHA